MLEVTRYGCEYTEYADKEKRFSVLIKRAECEAKVFRLKPLGCILEPNFIKSVITNAAGLEAIEKNLQVGNTPPFYETAWGAPE